MTIEEEFGPDRLELPCGTETLIVGKPADRLVVGIQTRGHGGHNHIPYATSHNRENAARLRDYLDEILKDKT